MAAASFDPAKAGDVVLDLVDTINANRQYLSEIDGAIGDGDHGINMSKGFTACGERIRATQPPPGLAAAYEELATVLMDGIGGSMGPLYGSFFFGWAQALSGRPSVDAVAFGDALAAAVAAVAEIGGAAVGDKTLMDTLIPARDAYAEAVAGGASFVDALRAMAAGAERGRDSTRDLVAKVGRAARLGERSRGVLDAGATSCCLILQSIAASTERHLRADG